MTGPKFDDRGLIPAIAQDRLTGEVRMVAWMNAEALQKTLESGQATFFSRSRNELWKKGETSGHFLRVNAVYADCDADTLLLLVDPVGPSCHTGRPTCFFRKISTDGSVEDVERQATPFLGELTAEIASRAASTATKSYTKSLLDGGAEKIGEKLREEADELARALENESADRVANEASDLIYHLLVGLELRGISLRQVIEVLSSRSGTSGHVEKAQRGRNLS